MPAIITRGAASAKGFGFAGGSAPAVYIEDVFSTYLYTGNNTSQTITNGIDLSNKGGLVWIKSRAGTYVRGHYLYDTARGTILSLSTDTTGANANNSPNGVSAYNTTGFDIVGAGGSGGNGSGTTYASWTFRKQPKFFDVVTYTGTGANTTIAHSLGSVPGCIMVKRTDTTGNWQVYHTGLTSAAYSIQLNLTAAQASATTVWNSTTPTSTVFSVGTDASVNASGGTYVAYVYAHNAGGFGLAGTDNVISCGSVSYTSSSQSNINLGFEPQWILFKRSDDLMGWYITDNMRGWAASGSGGWGNVAALLANTTAAEDPNAYTLNLNSTGFSLGAGGFTTGTYIYIAIRRGPMKVPTSGTSVFAPVTRAGTNASASITGVGFPPDMVISKSMTTTYVPAFYDKLRVPLLALRSSATTAETSNAGSLITFNQDGITVGDDASLAAINYSGTYINHFFKRAPGFFDEVCYTGTGTATTQTHNLGAVPELMIVKDRTSAFDWTVNPTLLGSDKVMYLDAVNALTTDASNFTTTLPTLSVFSLGNSWSTNKAADNYVAYLFATCPGVSKVGSYTGNGTTQTINCGFAAGARFVLIKRTDSTGDWYTYDTARGMTTLTDPYLLLNSTAAEVATLGSVTTVTTGFALNSTILAAINVSAGTYIFLAIA